MAAAVLSAAPARAQEVSKGLLVGFDSSRISPDPSGTSISMKSGFLAGGYVALPVKKTIGVIIEAEYNQKHAAATTGNITSELKLDYLEVPVMAKLPLFKGFYMEEGAAFGFPVRANTETGTTTTDVKNTVTNPDVSLIISAGKAINSAWMIEGRYDGGVRHLMTTAGSPVQRTRSFAVILRARL
jgi:hypothetical protein